MDPDSPLNNPHELWDDAEVKARIGRRVLSRLRRTPGMFDGDGDGFVYNPRTGRDNMPAPRRSMVPRKPKPDRRVVLDRPLQSQTTASRWNDDDDDPLAELTRGLGIGGPRNADRMTAAARQMAERRREQGANFSPVDVDRKNVPVKNFSRNTFLSLMDDLIDYTKTLKDNPVNERANKRIWKLLFVMQKLENMNGLKQNGNDIDLRISQDELKRLYKGLESLIDDVGEWSDKEDAKELFAQIKKLYRADWSKVGSEKSSSSDIEMKVLGSRIGRRARSAVRRAFGRASRIDGDGDGFTTNPRTGKDDVPVASVPDVNLPKKPMTSADIGMRQLRARGRMYEQASEAARRPKAWRSDPFAQLMATFFGSSSPRTPDEIVDYLKTSIQQSDIKNRPWNVYQKRIDQIEKELKDQYGNLDTLNDFKNAFRKINKKTKFEDFNDQLTTDEKGFLIGLLYQHHKFPERFARPKNIVIQNRPGREQGGASTGFDPKYRPRNKRLVELFEGERIKYKYYGVESMRDSATPPGQFLDTVSTQIMKSYLGANLASANSDTLADQSLYLKGLGEGLHEGTHALHYLAAMDDLFPEDATAVQITAAIKDLIDSDPADVFDTFQYLMAHDELSNYVYARLKFMQEPSDIDQLLQDMLDDATQNGTQSDVDQVKQIIAARGLAKKKTDDFFDLIKNAGGGQKYSAVADAFSDASLGRMRSDTDINGLIGKLANENRQEVVELMVELLSKETGESPSAMRNSFRGSDSETAVGAMMLFRRKLWDDLSTAEIALLRKNWKYISKYAKDKNSWYNGTTLGVSVEGAAEAMTLRIFGFDFPQDKVPQEVRDALNKWLKWIAGKDY